MNRRKFIRNTSWGTAAVVLSGTKNLFHEKPKNKLPKWKGFNLTDFNTPDPSTNRRSTTEDHLKWMSDWGFDFIRLPISYPYYLKFDRSTKITPAEVYQIDEASVDKIDKLVQLAQKHNLHVCLNLHRAPGYCINAGFSEPYNLWKDDEAQKAFDGKKSSLKTKWDAIKSARGMQVSADTKKKLEDSVSANMKSLMEVSTKNAMKLATDKDAATKFQKLMTDYSATFGQ